MAHAHIASAGKCWIVVSTATTEPQKDLHRRCSLGFRKTTFGLAIWGALTNNSAQKTYLHFCVEKYKSYDAYLETFWAGAKFKFTHQTCHVEMVSIVRCFSFISQSNFIERSPWNLCGITSMVTTTFARPNFLGAYRLRLLSVKMYLLSWTNSSRMGSIP